MDEIPEARFLSKDNMVFDVWYYCYSYVVYVVHVASIMCALSVLYYIASVHVIYSMLLIVWHK